MSNNPRVENVFIGGCGSRHAGDHPELDMFSEWIKERVSGGHVMARPALGLTLNVCMAWPHSTALWSS